MDLSLMIESLPRLLQGAVTTLKLLLSSLFEHFSWSPLSLLGLAAAMAGNFFILRPDSAGRRA